MAQTIHPPLKRHESLQPLSRDRYVGLVEAQHLIRSADAMATDRAGALADFVQAWAGEISAHFSDEERLPPELVTGEPVERLYREHRAPTARRSPRFPKRAASSSTPRWIRSTSTKRSGSDTSNRILRTGNRPVDLRSAAVDVCEEAKRSR